MKKSESSSLLNRIYIAAPCNASWDAMKGTDTVRNCGDCSRNVFNLSEMTRTEAEVFLQENGVSQCLRFYQRQDGTIMTDDCPVGLRKIRNIARRVKNTAAIFIGAMLSTVGAFAQSVESADSSKSEENSISETLWKRHRPGMLSQLGVVDCFPKSATFEIPSYSALRSGNYALGKELVERQGRLFVLIEKSVNSSKKSKSKSKPIAKIDLESKYELESVPTVLTFVHSDLTAKILESQKHYAAAEAFHKIYIKTIELGGSAATQYRQPIACDYRDFLLRQKRCEEAATVEKDFSLASEGLSKTNEEFTPESKKVRINLPSER